MGRMVVVVTAVISRRWGGGDGENERMVAGKTGGWLGERE